MLACARCGKGAYAALRERIIRTAKQHEQLYFVTLYFDPKYRQDVSDLPLFKDQSRDEKKLLVLLGKIFRALRDKARRAGYSFEYVLVVALGKVRHKYHRRLHSHALVTWLPDLRQKKSKRPERLESVWLDKKMSSLQMIAWVEKPRSVGSVAAYTAQNLQSVIGKKEYKGMRTFRMSQGWEK